MKKILLLFGTMALATLIASPASAGIVYDNLFGNGNFNVNGWNVTTGIFSAADSFVLGSSATIDGVQLAFWTYPNDTVSSINWSFQQDDGADPLLGSIIESGTANSPPEIDQFPNSTDYFNISIETFSIPAVLLDANTTYWLQISANTQNAFGLFWDESDGPSLGYHSAMGSIPSESFQLLGNSPVQSFDSDPVPEPGTFALVGGMLMAAAALRRRKS